MSNSNRGSVSSHFDDSHKHKNNDNRGGYYRDRSRNDDDHKEDHRGGGGDYRRRDSKGRRRNRWDDDERDSLSSSSSSHRSREDKDGKEYRRHWRDRSRSPVEKRNKSPDCRVRKDIFENVEDKKDESYSKKSRNNYNWSDSSDDDGDGLKLNKRRQGNQPEENGAESYGSFQYNESKSSFPAGSQQFIYNDNNGNSLSKPNFYQNLSTSNYSQPQAKSEVVRDDQTKSMVNLKFPLPEISESKTKTAASGIQIRLLPTPVKASPVTKPVTAKPKVALKVASVFNVDDDDDEEEMPAECKMRMKNIGRETPTSAGPNSFGKTKIGFCNMATIKERRLQEDILKKK